MDNILEVRDLVKHFKVPGDGRLKAVDGVSFAASRRGTLGIVGESGCGKSTLAKTVLRLYEPTSGSALLDGEDLFSLDASALKAARRKMQMVFQDPFSSLNPRRTVEAIIGQPLEIHRMGSIAERRDRVAALMEEVGLDSGLQYRRRYPHQFSGGQRQRIGIARALALRPELLICDEAVSALDVSIQAQIINLLLDLRDRYGLSYLFIAHDLSVVEFISDRIVVMYLGRVVEEADTAELARARMHPYTEALFAAAPRVDPGNRGGNRGLIGDMPSPLNPPAGCYFRPRCPRAMPRCAEAYPERKEAAPGHFVACHLY
jgi:oligopeptide/dipeptide ABC transporter ATP-binding protein